jgi:hypothetical protein
MLNIGSLWLLGASAPDQSKWFIVGNLLNNPRIFEFDYPILNNIRIKTGRKT